MKITKLTCLRCNHTWWPRPETEGLPKQCPNCKSVKWNVERGEKNGENRSIETL